MNQGKNIEQLMDKGRTSPPVMSLSEVNGLLKKTSRFKNREKQWYIPIGLMSVMLLLSWYMHTPEPGPAAKVSRWTAPHAKIMAFSLPKPKRSVIEQRRYVTETAKEPVRPQQTVMLVSSPQSVVNTSVKEDTLKVKTDRVVKPSVVKYNEMMIPWFADRDALKIYQDKLAAEGITFTILEVRYEDKTRKGSKVQGNRMVYLKGELSLHNQFYKTIQVKDFKELRIGWETDSLGTIRIKSMNYLDKNYMSRKL